MTWPWYVFFALVAGAVGTIISSGFLGESLAALGIPDPGRLTTVGMPFVRAAGWILASLGAGSFLASAFLISPRMVGALPPRDATPKRSERNAGAATDDDCAEIGRRLLDAPLSVDGYLAARTGAFSALSFALLALLMIPLTLSDVSGQPLGFTIRPENWSVAIGQVAEAKGWLAVAGISGAVGIAALFSRRWGSQPLLLVGAILSAMPLALQGHSAAGGDHDFGTNSYIWHIVFLLLWVGGLMALIAHCRRLGPGQATAVRRYSTIALVSIVGMTISGVVNALIRVEPQDWLTTTYGLIIVTKAAGAVILGGFGLVHRRFAIPALRTGGASGRRVFTRVAIVEVAVMAAVTGVAISMGRTPPPPPRDPNLSPMAIVVGFDLHKEPTFWNIWTMWRFDLMFGTVGLVLAGLYLWGLVILRRRGESWPWWRTFWFLLGSLGLALMMSSGMGMNMMALYSMHMIVHMGLSMVIPVFLVLGAPLTLVMRAARPGTMEEPGLREWAWALCHARLTRWLTHPGVNTVQFVSIFYVLYLTPFFDVLVSEHGGHVVMNWCFLVSGYLYFWEMIGDDPVPRRGTPMNRLGWLIFSMPFHLYFGVYLMQIPEVVAEPYYSSLQLPWGPDLMADQRVGAGVMWAAGSFPLVVVFGTLFYQWYRFERRKSEDYDRRVAEAHDVDEEMDAYNDWLKQLNDGR